MEQKIKRIFAELLGIEESKINNSSSYNSLEGWDSLKHLEIVSRLEEEFGISISMDDIIAMSDFGKVIKIVQKYIDPKNKS